MCVLPLLLGCLACDVEVVLALMKGSLACCLVLCLPYVARLFGLRCRVRISSNER